MTTTTAPQSVPTIGDVARQLPGWLREHLWSAVTGAVVGGVIGYVVNVFLIAVRYGGWRKVPHGAPATSHGNFFQGALFWGLLTTVLFGVFGYWHAVGTTRFLADLRALPSTLAAMVRGDRAAGVHLLWGAAIALLAAQIIAPAAGAVLALGVLAGAPTVLGSIVSTFLRRIWSALVKQIAPTRHHRVTGVTGMTVGLLGSAASLIVASFVTDGPVKYALAAALALAAVLISVTGARPPATACVVLLVGAVLAWHGLTDAVPAHADDGGPLECKLRGEPWLTCTGTSTVLRYAAAGAAAAGAGGILGSYLGHLAGALAGPPGTLGPDTGGPGDGGEPPWQPQPGTPPGDRQAINNWIQGLLDDPAFQRWRATHPGFTDPPTDAEFNQYLNWRHAQGMADPALTLPSASADFPVDAGVLPALPPPDEPIPPLPVLPALPPGPQPLDEGPSGDARGIPDQPPSPPDQPPAPAPPPAPDPAQAIRDRLRALSDANYYDPDPDNNPTHYWQRLHDLQDDVDPAKGLTPDQLKTLTDLEKNLQDANTKGLEAREAVRDAGMDQLKAASAQRDKDYTDYLHQLDATEARENYLSNLIDHLPPGQFEMANRVLQQIENGTPGADTAGALRQMTNALLTQAQGRNESDAAAAELDSIAAQEHEAAAVGWQHAAIAAEMVLAPFAVPLTAAGAAQLGAFMVGRNAVQGFGVGYEEGGLGKALLGAANAVLPINTLQAAYQATIGQVIDPNSPAPQAGRGTIALAMVQDLGNAVGLHSLGINNIGPAATDAVKETSTLSALHGGQPPPGPVPTATAATDAAYRAEQAAGQKAADEFQRMAGDLRALKAQGASADEIAAAQKALQQKAIAINSDYQAKATLKTVPKEIQKEYADALNPVLTKAQQDTVAALNAQGYTRGGRPLTSGDLIDLRNAKSMGTVGMDRDLALNQMAYRQTLAQLEKAPPTSLRADDLLEELKQFKGTSQLEHNGVPVSPSKANDDFQAAYKKAYSDATGGQDADKALQSVTQSKHPEAYQDLPVLKNDALGYPPDPKWAAQTGSVTTYKTYMNPKELSPGSALQETARGVEKDIKTKLEPMMYYYQGADPAAYQRVLDMKSFLGDCGKGVYTPTQMEMLSRQKFGTSINGLAQQVDSNLSAFVQGHGALQPAFRTLPGPGPGDLGGHLAQAAGGQAGNVAKGIASGQAPADEPAKGT
ncbi:OmpH family outer membrane protein [Kitasatospora cathayae]|uniref:OmpH family outer membrane protein n=1 Tax=Kitasatospora cathayae TaxID=3004092 RepID=A0ABY7QF67_9ACTN|nr:OmpH family outer membrane protein [Kitasatospora sp. HUAS 3-15]WBP91039.1 OmpH family outer membrane protein [Kitasatospora sp. HUAS 3-15]